jgi:hypothetical protein
MPIYERYERITAQENLRETSIRRVLRHDRQRPTNAAELIARARRGAEFRQPGAGPRGRGPRCFIVLGRRRDRHPSGIKIDQQRVVMNWSGAVTTGDSR